MPVRAILKSIRQLRFNNNWWCSRAILMTIGQLCFYDQIKQTLLASGLFGDNLVTHFTSSLGAVEMLFFFLEYKKPCFQNGSTTFPRVPSPRRWPSRLMCSKRGQWTQSQVFKFISADSVCLYLSLTFYFSLSLFLRRVRQLSRRVQDDIERGTDGVLQGLHPGLRSPRSPDHPHLHLLWATQNELRILPRTKMNEPSALTMTSGCANEI